MRAIKLMTAALLLVGLAGQGSTALAAREMADSELDGVAAGSFTADFFEGAMSFSFGKLTSDFYVDGMGSLELRGRNFPTSYGSITMTDNAQQNLSSLVNITAVDSAIQVLLNLNLNVNSTVGTISQFNLSGGF